MHLFHLSWGLFLLDTDYWVDSFFFIALKILCHCQLKDLCAFCWEAIKLNHYYLIVICPEKAMAPHSSTLAWKIPWMEKPDRLQSMGLLRVRHDWATSLSLFTFMHWRRKWQPTPVFLPGDSQGRRSLVGCCLWGRRVRHDWSDLAAAADVFLIIIKKILIL